MADPGEREALRTAFSETIAEILGIEPSEVREERTWDELDADSLALTEIALILDDAFAIRLPDIEPEDMRTVGDAFALVEQAVAQRTTTTAPGGNATG